MSALYHDRRKKGMLTVGKPLKRFTRILALLVTGLKPGANENVRRGYCAAQFVKVHSAPLALRNIGCASGQLTLLGFWLVHYPLILAPASYVETESRRGLTACW